MKKYLFTILPLVLSSVLTAGQNIKLEKNKEIEVYATDSVHYLEQSITTYGLPKGDLLGLISELKKIGFGKKPPSPPWHRELNSEEKQKMSEEDINAQKSYLEEAKERVSRMGKKDFETLKALDANSDFKLQENEAEDVIYNYVKAKVDKQLEVDQNNDNKLTLTEYMIGISVKGKVGEDGADWHQRSHFNREDENNDGFVDESESIAYHANEFTRKSAMILINSILVIADKDKNLELSKAEFKDLFKENTDFGKFEKSLIFPVNHKDLWSTFYWSRPEQLLTQLK